METYRVFVTRYYIAVEYFDILAKTERKAEKTAIAAAKALSPDPRLTAIDNGWIADSAVDIKFLGYPSTQKHLKLVYKHKDGSEAYSDKEGR
jgi:hypothetical protein